MVILILANNDLGLYKFRKELLKRLNKKYKMVISIPFGHYINKLHELGGQYVNTKLNRHGINPISDFKLFLHYKKLIKAYKPDIVLTYTIKPNI